MTPLMRPNQMQSFTYLKQWLATFGLDMNSAYPFGWGLPAAFGDGSDGDLTLGAGTTSLAAHALKQYNNLTVPVGSTLTTTETTNAALLIWVKNRCLIDGTVTVAGKGLAGSAVSGGDGTSLATSFGASGGGGGGMTGSAGGNGGATRMAGGSGGVTTGAAGNPLTQLLLARFRTDVVAKGDVISSYGGGGGAGKTNPGNGGNGGGVIVLICKELTVTGTVSANGGNGQNAGSSPGSGGGGGGGGTIFIITQKYSNTGTVSADAGTGGTGLDVGFGGGAGGAGTIVKEIVPTA